MSIIIACSKPWFRPEDRSERFNSMDIEWISEKDALTSAYLRKVNPSYVFFPHWNWIVEKEIHEEFECVVFHTAPLPWGRGGSPIQNLILAGLQETPVCALRMRDEIDGGPIYGTRQISLTGTISEIFSRVGHRVEELILEICANHPTPIPQRGEPHIFKRLSSKNNRLTAGLSADEIYDRIRMVDGLDYPRAFCVDNGLRIEFSNAEIANGQLTALAKFIVPEEPSTTGERNESS